MAFRFEELTVWQQARDFSGRVHTLTASFPKHELYALASQMNRAADAVCLLIAEGSGLMTRALLSHRLSLAIGEAFEVTAGGFLALDRGYITEDEHARLYNDATIMCRAIASFRKTLR